MTEATKDNIQCPECKKWHPNLGFKHDICGDCSLGKALTYASVILSITSVLVMLILVYY